MTSMPNGSAHRNRTHRKRNEPLTKKRSPPDFWRGSSLACYAACRSIQAYTSRSLHRRCFPILYAGNPHSRHLSRTVRSGMARISATSRADSIRLEPPRVPFCGRGSLAVGITFLPSCGAGWVVPSSRPIVSSRPVRADTRESGTMGRSLIVTILSGASAPPATADLVGAAVAHEVAQVPVKRGARHSGKGH